MLEISYVEIMDIPFINITKDDFLHKIILPLINENKKSYIVTANPEIVMKTQEDPTYKQVILQADYVIPDGAGIILASKYMKNPLKERIAGFDLMVSLLAHANKNNYACYFLGADKETNEKTIMHIRKNYPGIRIAGFHHGYFQDSEPIISEIQTTKPDLIFVALGMPKQEKWIVDNYHKFEKGLFMGVGGSFDVLSGKVKRAPQGWINWNLEWLYRLIQQPFRLKRLFKVIRFMMRIILKRE